jgi:hypothetical protein
VLVYMAACPGECASASPSSLDWFKIYHAGLVSGTSARGKWGASEMIKNDNSLTVKIPMLKAGNYLVRHETIVSRICPLTTEHELICRCRIWPKRIQSFIWSALRLRLLELGL